MGLYQVEGEDPVVVASTPGFLCRYNWRVKLGARSNEEAKHATKSLTFVCHIVVAEEVRAGSYYCASVAIVWCDYRKMRKE